MCVDFTTVAQLTSLLRTAYIHYFDCKIGDQDKSDVNPGLWIHGNNVTFNIVVLMVVKEPRSHTDYCRFCLSNITGFNASSIR